MASNAKSGEKLFMSKCAQCHTVDRGAGHKQGPNLNGLFGKRCGSTPDYSYSAANKNMAVVWGESTLQDYLLDPKKYIPHTKMNFPGLKEPQERRDLTAYLKEQSFSSSFLNSKNNPFHIQRYIPRSWKKIPCSTLHNSLKEEMNNEPPMCSPNPSIHLLIDSIRCLSTQGQLSKAFKSFSLLQRHSSSSYFLLQPISSLLSVSTNLNALPQGKQLHAHIISLGFLDNSFLTSRLSSFYSTVGLLSDARIIVEDSRTQHAFPWNLLIFAYIRKGFWMDAILAYKRMVDRGSEIDKFTCPAVLRACSEICDLHLGRVVHGRIEITGLQHDLFIQNSLVSMYAKSGAMKIARKLFDLMSERDIVTWNSLISGYSSMGMLNETFELLEKMQLDSKMNTVTWNTIATLNSQMGSHLEALELISKMRMSDSSTDSVSLVIGLDSCSRMGYLRQGKEIHGLALRLHYNELENVSNALITMYSKCKQIEVAYRLFKMRTSKSLITWNAIIAGFVVLDQEEEAFIIFREMIRSQIKSNYVTMMVVLPLCARLKNLHYGREIHCHITRHRFDNYHLLSNSLIDMYSKNGRISAAQNIFDDMSDYDVVSYTSMIAGYGMHGEGMKALNLFLKMTNSGIEPDSTAMVNILSACSHSGLVTEGEILFKKIMGLYGIVPQVEHYSCMVDLFGQAGLLSKAEELITQMPFEPSTSMLVTLVQACRAHGNREIGFRVAKKLLQMKPDYPSHYVLVANMYAYCKNWEELSRVRAVMSDKGIIESYLLLGGLNGHMRDVGYIVENFGFVD